MQISTKQFFKSQLNTMLAQQSRVGRLQEEISTGKKILQPSDDPSGYAKISSLKQGEAAVTQYDRNMNIAIQRLTQEENVLKEATNAAVRLQELAIRGASDTLSPSDRKSLGDEMKQISEQLASIANTVDANGDYLFSGFQAKVKPFELDDDGAITFNGDAGRREVEIAKGVKTPTSSTGSEVFMKVRMPGNQGSASIFDVIKDAADALGGGLSSGPYVNKMKATLDHFTSYQTIAGSRLQKVESVQNLGAAAMTSSKIMRSNLEDANIEDLATEMQHQLLSLNASQTTFTRIAQLSLFNYLK